MPLLPYPALPDTPPAGTIPAAASLAIMGATREGYVHTYTVRGGVRALNGDPIAYDALLWFSGNADAISANVPDQLVDLAVVIGPDTPSGETLYKRSRLTVREVLDRLNYGHDPMALPLVRSVA